MNDKEKALHIGELLLAEKAGETIQFHVDTDAWEDIGYASSGTIRSIISHPEWYRIKPKVKTAYVNLFKTGQLLISISYTDKDKAINDAKRRAKNHSELKFVVIAQPIPYEEPE